MIYDKYKCELCLECGIFMCMVNEVHFFNNILTIKNEKSSSIECCYTIVGRSMKQKIFVFVLMPSKYTINLLTTTFW